MQQTVQGAIGPEVIKAAAIPVLSVSHLNPQPSFPEIATNTSEYLAPTSIPNMPLPDMSIAGDVIGTALDTQSKKILGNFNLGPMGAIRVGRYTPGVNGEVDITPNGIVGEDANGNTTFSLDGLTGNSIFFGTVRAQNFVISDTLGLISLNNFNNAAVQANGANQHFTNSTTSLADVTSSSLSFTLGRTANVLLFAIPVVYAYFTGAENSLILGRVAIVADGVIQASGWAEGGVFQNDSTGAIANNSSISIPIITIAQLTAGSHTIKLQAGRDITVGSPGQDFVVNSWRLGYAVLGS